MITKEYLQEKFLINYWQLDIATAIGNYSNSEKGFALLLKVPEFIKIIYRFDNTIDYFYALKNASSYKISEDELKRLIKKHNTLRNFK